MFRMKSEEELKINARGLSAPGPRLMVETALAKGRYGSIRVVVSDESAVSDLKEYFAGRNHEVKVDQVGEDFHVLVDFED
jgi:TusA-related sulfurtransferase